LYTNLQYTYKYTYICLLYITYILHIYIRINIYISIRISIRFYNFDFSQNLSQVHFSTSFLFLFSSFFSVSFIFVSFPLLFYFFSFSFFFFSFFFFFLLPFFSFFFSPFPLFLPYTFPLRSPLGYPGTLFHQLYLYVQRIPSPPSSPPGRRGPLGPRASALRPTGRYCCWGSLRSLF